MLARMTCRLVDTGIPPTWHPDSAAKPPERSPGARRPDGELGPGIGQLPPVRR
jgi:hypothetical protein